MRPLSARNPRVQRLARLARRREERTRERALVVEGPTAISGALDAAVVVQEIYVEDGAADRPPVAAVLARLATVDGAPHPWEVPAGVLERIAGAAQGVVAIVEEPAPDWPTPDRCRFVLVLVDVADPGNVGTLVRAAVASGAGAVIVVGGADPMGPKVLRTAAGTAFLLPVLTSTDAVAALARLRTDGYRTVAAVLDPTAQAYDSIALDGPVAVVVGNEAHGLDPQVVDAADARTTITMAGPAESLNVAMAGTLLCFEVLRRG